MKEAGDAGIVTWDRSDKQGLFAFMQSIARQQPGRRLALDVGACDGQSSLPYAQAGWKVISLDIVMLGLRLGLRAGRIQPGRAVVADGRHLPFCDATFDLVSSRWFLHEFPDQPAFPYMNRALRGARYIAQAPSLTWKKGGRNITFWSYKIAIGHLEDRARAEKVAQGLVDLVNRHWERREEIEPDHEMHKPPGPLEVYNLLPRTNCRACGQPACYMFALKLTMAHVKLEDCPVLQEPACAGQWAQLLGLLPGEMPAIGRRERG